MAREETKGFLTGQMKFGVGDDVDEVGEAATLLPLRVLVLADLVPGDDWNAGASAPPTAIRVTSAELDGLFAKLRPRIALEVPSLVDDGRMVRVDLSPSSLKSFRPDGLCAEVPLLRALLDGRPRAGAPA
jgi:type VI secretion system protein ImpC